MTTTTPTRDAKIAARRAELTKACAERLDPLDYPRVWTQRQCNQYEAEATKKDQQLAIFNTAVETLAALGTDDAADTKWRDHLIAWRTTIDAELLAMPPRIRNEKELEQQQRLKWSIRLINEGFGISTIGAIVDLSSTRLGELMTAAGHDVIGLEPLRGPNGFRGPLPAVEARLKASAAQRAAAQAALDVVLLTDDERAKADAEGAELNAAYNAMNVTHGSDGGLVAHTDDGDVLPVAAMTPLQKRAFERADARHRQEQADRLEHALGRGPMNAVAV